MAARNLPARAFTQRRLPPLPGIRDFLNIYRINPKRVLSQNFLMDMNMTRKLADGISLVHLQIVRKTGDLTDCYALEIGPGPGSITRAILETGCRRLDVVEIDDRFLPTLRHLQDHSEGRLHIHHGDILKSDVETIWREAISDEKVRQFPAWNDADLPPCHIIGNLPFNIATPLIIKYLKEMSRRRGAWAFGRVPLVLTFQKEVALRILGEPDSDHRSRIGVISQYVAEPKILFEMPGECFAPRPKIDVGVVRFEPRVEPLIQAPFELVSKVLWAVFQFRQKVIIRGLRTLYPPEMAESMAADLVNTCRLNPTHISVQMTMENFSDICLYYKKQCEEHPGLWLYDRTKPTIGLEQLRDRSDSAPPEYQFGQTENWNEREGRRKALGNVTFASC